MPRWLSALLLLLVACRGEGLTAGQVLLRLDPTSHDFGAVPLGGRRVLAVRVFNDSRFVVRAQAAVAGPFLTVEPAAFALAPGETPLTVRYAPGALGVLDGGLTLTAEVQDLAPLTLRLAGESVAIPACPEPGPCATVAFDVEAERCVETPRREGDACAAPDRCTVGTTCRGGRCVGEPRVCDDGDACTTDTCHPERGCEARPRGPCPGDGLCHVGACEPRTGCVLVPAADGLPCGAERTCTRAGICLAGACELRTPPDGFVCAEASPCQPEGRCRAQVCERDGAVVPVAATWVSGPVDAGPAWSDAFFDLDGGLVLSSYFMSPTRVRAQAGGEVLLAAGSRRCVRWGPRLACADFPGGVVAGVSAVDPTTGAVRWTYGDGATHLAALVGPSSQLFLARLVVASDARLLALFEAQTLNAGIDRCRRFGVVLLDERGAPLRWRTVDDPLFATCNHPHSYGVATDAQGNLYLAFTPSSADNPAVPLGGTWLVSYAPDLTQRWSVTVPGLEGGELAVADGVLLHQAEGVARAAATGAVLSPLARPAGLPSLGRSHWVSLEPDAGAVEAAPRASLPGWRYQPDAGRWLTPPKLGALGGKSVVVGVAGGAPPALVALELATGREVFSCPLVERSTAANLEVGVGEVAVMADVTETSLGAGVCERCDPKWARTRARFLVYPVQGLGPAVEPWPGAWGGGSHGHHELP